MRRTIISLAVIAAAFSGTAWGHPGHGTTDPSSTSHYLFEPLHAVPLALLVFAIPGVWLVVRTLRKHSTAKSHAARPERDPRRNAR